MRRFYYSSYNKKDNSGVTFVELIVVIAIMTTLVGLIVPQYMRYVTTKKEKACVENRDAVVNICEKMVYSGVPLSEIQACVAEITSTGTATTHSIPTEYEEALKSHWICPVDGSTMSVTVNLSTGVITASCSEHGTQDVVADVSEWGGSGDTTADPGFLVPTVGTTPVAPTPTPTPTPEPEPTSQPISSSFWPYLDDPRWDAAGRYSGSKVTLNAPSGKFAMRNSSGATAYYVLIDKNGSGHVDIHIENAFDPSGYLCGRDSECVIATNGTEYTYDSISQAATTIAGLKKASDDPNITADNEEYLISGGTIYYNGTDRYIYFHQGQEYAKLPTANNIANNSEQSGNKFGNWYRMKNTDEYQGH